MSIHLDWNFIVVLSFFGDSRLNVLLSLRHLVEWSQVVGSVFALTEIWTLFMNNTIAVAAGRGEAFICIIALVRKF